MAALDSFERFPIWQRIALFFVVAAGIAAAWYFVYYEEAVTTRVSARASLDKAAAELERVTEERQKFLERQKQTGEVETELKASMEVLPMSTAAVDNLMQTFQQQARLVGLTVEAWTPEPEEKLDYYARLPVKVKASGTWAQAGEFFRRVSELDRPVSIEGIRLVARDTQKRRDDAKADGPAVLDVDFQVTTYRFLPAEERGTDDAASARKKKPPRRRK